MILIATERIQAYRAISISGRFGIDPEAAAMLHAGAQVEIDKDIAKTIIGEGLAVEVKADKATKKKSKDIEE